jgi:hypothetical protein
MPKDNLRVATESFRPYWDDIMRVARVRFRTQTKMPDNPFAFVTKNRAVHGGFDAEAFLVWAGISKLEYELVQKAMKDPDGRQTLPFGVVDQILVSAGMVWVVTSLYMVDATPRSERESLTSCA